MVIAKDVTEYVELHCSRETVLHPHIVNRIQQLGAERVLDYGCGDGRLSEKVAELSCVSEVSCYDQADQMMAAAQQRLRALPKVSFCEKPQNIPADHFNAAVLSLVMTEQSSQAQCMAVLADCFNVLTPGGTVFLATTHPCFRDRPVSSFSTNFDMADYLRSGASFEVGMRDGSDDTTFTDFHWTLSDHLNQLINQGFVVTKSSELSDVAGSGGASPAPWLVIEAQKPKI